MANFRAISYGQPNMICNMIQLYRWPIKMKLMANQIWSLILYSVFSNFKLSFSLTIGRVLIVRFFWLWIASFSIPRNQKKCRKTNTQWIILQVTSPLLLKRSTYVLICTVWHNHVHLTIIEMSIHRYFKSKVNLPTPSQVQLSPNVLREVNQAVTAALECEKLGNQASKEKEKVQSVFNT